MTSSRLFAITSCFASGFLMAAAPSHPQAPPPQAQQQTQGQAPVQAQDNSESVTVENTTRTYLVHLPKNLDAKKKYPVVLVLHDDDNDAGDMARISHFDQTADQYGVIAVYPNALNRQWPMSETPQQSPRGGYGGHHRMGGGYPGGGGGGYPSGGGGYPGGSSGQGGGRRSGGQSANQLAFFNAMLDQLATEYPVDDNRIFATGFSAGGMMDFQLGCNMANRIAAIAPVGAEIPKALDDTCKNWVARPVPLLMINGTNDPVLPYKGSKARPVTLSAEDTAKAWAKTAGCANKPKESTLPARESGGMQTKVDDYTDCKQGAETILYSIVDGGHFWPGGEAPYVAANRIGKTSDDIEANEVIWKFFAAHPLSGGPSLSTQSSGNR